MTTHLWPFLSFLAALIAPAIALPALLPVDSGTGLVIVGSSTILTSMPKGKLTTKKSLFLLEPAGPKEPFLVTSLDPRVYH